MISKAVILSMQENFNEKFGQLSERSLYHKENVNLIMTHTASIEGITDVQRSTFEDDLWAVVSSASQLGYYIGLQEGVDTMRALCSADLPEKILDAFGELDRHGRQPL